MYTEVDEKRARSLTAETVDLLPFLPYLLQDLWELGSSPRDMVALMTKHMDLSPDTNVLDLACGKGAVSVNIAKELGINVYGFDLTHEFIEYATQKAKELHVCDLCHFVCGDINKVVVSESGYDCVIFGAVGNVLGDPRETLLKLAGTIKPGGYIIIDEAYLPDDGNNENIEYKNYDYLYRSQWLQLFADSGLTLVEELHSTEEHDFDHDNRVIAQRANELIARHPEKRAMFEGYIQSQLNECADLENNVSAVTWILQKTER